MVNRRGREGRCVCVCVHVCMCVCACATHACVVIGSFKGPKGTGKLCQNKQGGNLTGICEQQPEKEVIYKGGEG